MNKRTELDARRFKLIQAITEMDDECMIENLELYLTKQLNRSLPGKNYPFAPSNEELHRIIEQVLEDDRNGLFTDGEEFFEHELKEYMAGVAREVEAGKC